MCKLLQQQKTALADTEAAISYKERTSYPTPKQQATKNPPKRIWLKELMEFHIHNFFNGIIF